MRSNESKMSILKAALGTVATVRAVHVFRDHPPVYSDDGDAHALTTRDLLAQWPLSYTVLRKVKLTEDHQKSILKPGEVLLPSRGDYYMARHYNSTNDRVVPVGLMHVITAQSEILMPQFLAWFINQPAAQQYLKNSLVGTSIRSLNKASLVTLPISIPAMQVQQKIARLQELQMERSIIERRCTMLNEDEIQAVCQNILSKASS